MQALLADWQLDQLAAVFEKDKLKIASKTEEQQSWNWTLVATQTPQGAFFPNESFLNNIEEYKYNRYIDIGKKIHILLHALNKNLNSAFLSKQKQ